MMQSSNKKEHAQTSNYFFKSTWIWTPCAFVLGLAVMLAFTHFTIKSQVKAILNADGDDAYLASNVFKHLHKRDAEEIVNSRVKRQTDPLAAHLVGARGPDPRAPNFQAPMRGHYFRWSQSAGSSFALMEIDYNEIGTMVVINKSGYYLVYSQVTYNGHGVVLVGHETVRISSGTYEFPLMTTLNTQQLSTPRSGVASSAGKSVDSGYHAGIFYLRAGDRVAVKPTANGANLSYTMGEKGSFFGVCLMHES